MKRSQLVTALALSLGVTGWFSPGLDSSARAADCDRHRSASCGCADSDRGLLDTLDDLACRMLDTRPRRPSLLSTLQGHRCDQPSCGVEPACGAEPNCGVEPTCGAEPNCGVEPGCGIEPGCGVAERGRHYVPRDFTMNHHVSPIIVPGHAARGHMAPRTYYAPQMHTAPQMRPAPAHVQPVPMVPSPHTQVAPAAPGAQPPAHPPAQRPTPPSAQPSVQATSPAAPPAPAARPGTLEPESIPVPQVQDSVTDPFRDDAAMQFGPRGIPAHPATHRMSAPQSNRTHGRQPVLHYDPQARSAPAHGHISSDPEPVEQTFAASSRRVGSAETSSRSTIRSARSSADVVPASASEPARLPARKPMPLQSASSQQLSDRDDAAPALPNPLRR